MVYVSLFGRFVKVMKYLLYNLRRGLISAVVFCMSVVGSGLSAV